MHIGVDLDNTLLNYDASILAAAEFLSVSLPDEIKTKNQVSKFLKSTDEGELCWQKIQGLAYGRFLKSHAKLYPGVKRFLMHCYLKGNPVTIVSHKTQYGHFDSERINLREVVLEFLDSQDLKIEKIYFENTHEEKIERIKRNRFSWFIDDLPKVIRDLQGLKTRLICFGIDFSDWQQIDNLILGEWSESEILSLFLQLTGGTAVRAEKNTSGGNGAVYRLFDSQKKSYKLKLYPADSVHDRLQSEFESCSMLIDFGLDSIPKPMIYSAELGVGIYEWVDGLQLSDPSEQDLKQCTQFLAQLHRIGKKIEYESVSRASAACLSGLEIELQIRSRLNFLEDAREIYGELNLFLCDFLNPILENIIDLTRKNWNLEVDYETLLPREYQTLSPSDFGFHNAIKKSDDSIVFIDFEYFGWDDPTKLIADFVLHPGMNLSTEMTAHWLEETTRIYGEETMRRYAVSKPFYGLIWSLILLNDFREEIWTRRVLANPSRKISRQLRLESQLDKAKNLLRSLEEQYL